MFKALQKLKADLEAVGATLDYSDGDSMFYCDAPSGYEWCSDGCTVISEQFMNHSGQTWLTQAIKEARSRLAHGLEKVTDGDAIAEYRHLKDDDTWGDLPSDALAFIAFDA